MGYDVLTYHKNFPDYAMYEAVPPAWMRLRYAYKIKVFSYPYIHRVLLGEAQEEIHTDPRCLQLEGVNLDDEQIKEIFEVDYQIELQQRQKRDEAIDKQSERLEKYMFAIEECQAVALAVTESSGAGSLRDLENAVPSTNVDQAENFGDDAC